METKKEFFIDGESPVTVTEETVPGELVIEKRYEVTNEGIKEYADTYKIHHYTDEFGNSFKYKEKIDSRYLRESH